MSGHRMKIAAVALLAAAALLSAAAPVGATATGGSHRLSVVSSAGALTDLSPATDDVTDGARAAALAASRSGTGSIVALAVRGIDRSAAGTMYGAHVHVGPCVPGDGAAAGPHYNTTGGTTIDRTTEVWLDFTVGRSGSAVAVALVPFVVPSGGARSIVIHAMPTMPNGAAGARLACLPLEL